MSTRESPAQRDDLLDTEARGAQIHTIMGTGLPTVEQNDTLRDVAKELTADDIGAVLVKSSGGPVGVVSERDITVAVAMGFDVDVEQVKTAMSVDLVASPATAPIADVGRLMVRSGVRHVIVRDGSQVLGVVSMRDVLGALLA